MLVYTTMRHGPLCLCICCWSFHSLDNDSFEETILDSTYILQFYNDYVVTYMFMGP